jgi:hypothetical protein
VLLLAGVILPAVLGNLSDKEALARPSGHLADGGKPVSRTGDPLAAWRHQQLRRSQSVDESVSAPIRLRWRARRAATPNSMRC